MGKFSWTSYRYIKSSYLNFISVHKYYKDGEWRPKEKIIAAYKYIWIIV